MENSDARKRQDELMVQVHAREEEVSMKNREIVDLSCKVKYLQRENSVIMLVVMVLIVVCVIVVLLK